VKILDFILSHLSQSSNYYVAKHPSTGTRTDSRVVECIVEFVKSCGATGMVVGEGGAGSTERAFHVVEIRDVTARQKVRLVNLNRDLRVKVKVPKPLALEEVG